MSLMGTRVHRVEDQRLLTSGGRYLGDLDVAGAVHAVFVRSTMAHAAIRSIDTSDARRAASVLGVFTLDDLGLPPVADPDISAMFTAPIIRPWLADGVVRFVGEPIAVVVAMTQAGAVDAAALVVVDYDPRPAVVDVESAMGADAPLLFPEAGTNVAPGNYSERVVREYFLKPFQAAVQEAHADSLMPSYNEVDGIPSHANRHLLDDVLRHEWGFQGLVVSDYFAVNDLVVLHHVAANQEVAARTALESGVDVELPAVATYRTLLQQVRDGRVSESLVDRAVGRVLRMKFLTGLFDDPYVDPDYAEKVTNSPEHQKLSLKAAREAVILLKNQNGLLPLDRSRYKRIAVIGPNAGEVHLGGYSNKPGRGVSVLQGIRDKVGRGGAVLFSEGCRITESLPDWDADKVVLGDPALNAGRIQDAVQVARKADLVLLVLGENEQTSREAWAVSHLGDRDNLDLLSSQDDLAKAMVETGKPVVVLLLHGRPNSINYIAEHIPAILDGWYLGQEGGTAVADVLFGDANPGGKLPITVPRSVGQLPDYYYQKPSAKRGYLGSTTQPLFPFGWGLSYTTFKYANLRLNPPIIGTSGEAKVSVDVSNTGKLSGDEVAQLYIRDEVSSVTRPVKELRGFRRITLEPGETKTVEFTLGFDQLSFLDIDMHRVVEPGTFKVMVGGNSVDLVETTLTAK